MKLFSAFGAATVLERDRQTVARALRRIAPDGHEKKSPRWRLPTIIKALEASERANGKGDEASGGASHDLAVLRYRFDTAYDEMVAFPTLKQRRAAAKALVPLLADLNRKERERDTDLGHLVADQLWRLMMRGFEAPCQWTYDECQEHLSEPWPDDE